MSTATVNLEEQLARFGPDRCERLDVESARRFCHALATKHYENFSVLSRLVPARMRDDFAAVYAFCRWADDLGDEVGSTERALELLAWWRGQLDMCYAGQPEHPVFVALRPTILQHDLPRQPFDDLISAFEQDQKILRYESWDQLIDYCRLSANPVGRLVLMVGGAPRTDDFFKPSDAICTALQLTNHLQDVKRDLVERDRIYLPSAMMAGEPAEFERRMRQSAAQGHAVEPAFLDQYRELVRTCVERTWKLYEQGEVLLPKLSEELRPIVWLFAAGGQHVLRKVELWNYETILDRPALSLWRKFTLVSKARMASRRASVDKQQGSVS